MILYFTQTKTSPPLFYFDFIRWRFLFKSAKRWFDRGSICCENSWWKLDSS